MKQRIITGLILIVGAVTAFYCGGIVLKALAALTLLLAIKELLDLNRQADYPLFVKAYVYLASLAMFWFYENELLLPAHMYLAFILGIYMCVIVFEKFNITDAFMLIGMTSLVTTGIRGIYTICLNHGFMNIMYLALATYGCDTGAYFTGYFFGKHKLIERISPKKTIEGSLGGIALGTLLGGLFGMYFVANMPTLHIWLLAFVLTITSQFGDLTFSALKRHYQIKDFSNLLPGHGGVLDRTDSLIFNIVVYVIWFVFFI